jgi:hypothetical protein
MNRQWLVIALVVLAPACGKKSKPLGDKKTACDNIYSSYRSHQDPKVWADACMAAPDETVRCVNLIMDEGKDSACMKAVKSPERTKLVTVLNGTPAAAPAPAGSDTSAAAPAGEPGPVIVKLHDAEYGGTFDGTKAIAYVDQSKQYQIAMMVDCPAFGCDKIEYGLWQNSDLDKVCPNGRLLSFALPGTTRPKQGSNPASVGVNAMKDGWQGALGDTTVEISALTDDALTGSVKFASGDDSAAGTFRASICK